ncbi:MULTISPECIES: hypothetical protein [Allobacillus]|uniref:Uncharacterized protein n=1 Tax=Allobacillus salarius TaxID=1955272 RepID=A0A556PPA3_9BACI|nr:hypothetical protein [Allobacillus salarius]TSJ66222.1 hypothetical protein FPQ13_04955 [Allobacillus salarius]
MQYTLVALEWDDLVFDIRLYETNNDRKNPYSELTSQVLGVPYDHALQVLVEYALELPKDTLIVDRIFHDGEIRAESIMSCEEFNSELSA